VVLCGARIAVFSACAHHALLLETFTPTRAFVSIVCFPVCLSTPSCACHRSWDGMDGSDRINTGFSSQHHGITTPIAVDGKHSQPVKICFESAEHTTAERPAASESESFFVSKGFSTTWSTPMPVWGDTTAT